MDTRTLLESLYKDRQEEDKYLSPQEADDFEEEPQNMNPYEQMRLRSLMRQKQTGGQSGGGIDGNMMAGALRMFGGGMGGGAGASGTTGNAALDAMFGLTGGEPPTVQLDVVSPGLLKKWCAGTAVPLALAVHGLLDGGDEEGKQRMLEDFGGDGSVGHLFSS